MMKGPARSPLREVEARIPISLSPACLKKSNNSVKDGVDEQLNKLLMKYDPELGGVVLSYRKVRVNDSSGTSLGGHVGTILFGHPWIHLDVNVRLMLFTPQKGDKLEGLVKSVGPDHVNIVVHGMFNASVWMDGLPDAFTYDYDNDVWRSDDGAVLETDVKVKFEVIRLRPTDGVLALTASLKGASLGCIDDTVSADKLTVETVVEDTPKEKSLKKKKKSKKKAGSDQGETKKKRKRLSTGEDGTAKTPSQKKKKKKQKA